jgi:hypothetical protein
MHYAKALEGGRSAARQERQRYARGLVSIPIATALKKLAPRGRSTIGATASFNSGHHLIDEDGYAPLRVTRMKSTVRDIGGVGDLLALEINSTTVCI